MKLDALLEQGHHVIYAREQRRFAVRCRSTSGEEGTWLISAEALARVAFRKLVDPADVAGDLSADDRSQDYWVADETNCWCSLCRQTRKMLETQDE